MRRFARSSGHESHLDVVVHVPGFPVLEHFLIRADHLAPIQYLDDLDSLDCEILGLAALVEEEEGERVDAVLWMEIVEDEECHEGFVHIGIDVHAEHDGGIGRELWFHGNFPGVGRCGVLPIGEKIIGMFLGFRQTKNRQCWRFFEEMD